MTHADIDKNTLYLIYDDECPLCRNSAHALRIKKATGNLVLINAREPHPLTHSAYERGFDPDKGIIVIYNDQYYYGADAVHFLAMLNTPLGVINRMAATLLRSHLSAKIIYPFVKSIRRLLISSEGVGAIKYNNGSPLFANVLGDKWEDLPPLMKKRFNNREYSNDMVSVEGTMTIKSSLSSDTRYDPLDCHRKEPTRLTP